MTTHSHARIDKGVLDRLRKDAVLQEGHFVYHSGRHAGVLIDRDRLLEDPQFASQMGYRIAKRFFTRKIDVVATPSIWGAGLAQWVAYFLEPRPKVVYATPFGDGTRRIAENLHGMVGDKRILIVDNLIITGETMQRFIEQIESLQGEVIGVAALWDGADAVIAGHEVYGLLDDIYPAYTAEACPRCKASGNDATPTWY